MLVEQSTYERANTRNERGKEERKGGGSCVERLLQQRVFFLR